MRGARYANSHFVDGADGTPIAYQVHGDRSDESLPWVVMTNGFATSSFYWDDVRALLDGRARMVTWDLKGHGGSGKARDLSRCSIADCVDDLRQILDAEKVDKAALLGFSMGCQIVLEAWRHIPSRIAGIAPILGTYGRPFDSLFHPAFGPVAARIFRVLGPVLGPTGLKVTSRLNSTPLAHRLNQITGMVGEGLSQEKMKEFYHHLGEIHGPSWVALGLAAQRHTAQDLFPTIHVPVLIVSGGRDSFTPASISEEMERWIPGADHLHLPGAGHTGLYEYPREIADAVGGLLDRIGS